MKLITNTSINEPYIMDYKKMKDKDKQSAFEYMLLVEYELFKLHESNGISEHNYNNSLGKFSYIIKDYYSSSSIDSLITVDHGYYIGMLTHRKDNVKGRYVVSLYVDKDFRKNGIAYKLLKYLIDNCKEDRVTVLVGDFNTPAINLYKKLGFKPLDKSNIKGMTEYQLVKGDK